MGVGEIEMSKTQRTSKTGLLFFLLMQMSLFSKVWPTSETTTDTSQTLNTESMSMSYSASTNLLTSVDTSSSHATGSTDSNTESTSVHIAVSTMGISTATVNSSSVTENYSWLSCPAFVCTTDCFVQLMNATASPCPSSSFCEIMKQNASYSVNCSASCGTPCGNTTINCSWKCCNTTNCINDTLLALTNSPNTTAMTSSVAPTTSTSTMVTTKSTVPSTQATNGKKCHSVKCDGASCYKSNPNPVTCAVGQDYCMLKKTTSTTGTESWQAGCSDDCRKMAVCSATVTTCYLECCNATTTSCLKMTGDVNMPSSATRGPHSPALLVASLLLFWIVRVFT